MTKTYLITKFHSMQKHTVSNILFKNYDIISNYLTIITKIFIINYIFIQYHVQNTSYHRLRNKSCIVYLVVVPCGHPIFFPSPFVRWHNISSLNNYHNLFKWNFITENSKYLKILLLGNFKNLICFNIYFILF